jgi:excisionase family DNA binding protein
MNTSEKPGDERRLMTLEEVAEHLRIGKRTTYGWAKSGKLPGFKVGGTWRFDRADIDTWVEKQKGKGNRA